MCNPNLDKGRIPRRQRKKRSDLVSDEEMQKAGAEGRDYATQVLQMRRDQLKRQAARKPRKDEPALMGGKNSRWESVAAALEKEVAAGRMTKSEAKQEMRKHLLRSGVEQSHNPFS